MNCVSSYPSHASTTVLTLGYTPWAAPSFESEARP
jgi:hypothetical protein